MINDDGSVIVYQSLATNLVSGDTNGQSDIFRTSRTVMDTRRISLSATGTAGNGASTGVAISGDGNFAAFTSTANNLVANDFNATTDVFVVNLNTNAIEIVSRTSNGQAAGGFGRPSLSTTGRYVAFRSSSSLLTNSGVVDVFVRDRTVLQGNALRRVSQTQYGSASGGISAAFDMSDDAKAVAFGSEAKHLIDGDNNYYRDVYLTNLSYPWLPNTHTATLGVNQTLSNLHFGNRVLQGEATGVSWQDISRNGLREANEPVNVGRQIYVDTNNNSLWDSGESITTTDSVGAYRLTPIATGQQRIREILPADWTGTVPASSTFIRTFGTRSILFNFEELGPVTAPITTGVIEREGFVLAIGTSSSSQWRIEVPTGSNTIELVSTAPTENQHMLRKDYRPFSVSSISTRSASGAVINFVGELQDGSTVTQTISTPATKSTLNLTGFSNLRSFRWSSTVAIYIDNINVQTNENDYTGLDFGSMTAPVEIRGSLYYDDDRDGLRDAGERAISGRRVYLDIDNNSRFDANEPNTTSDASGNFAFTNINAGSYTVRQSLPANWTQTEPADAYSVTLVPNQIASNLAFGSWGTSGLVQGSKWNDLNANGVRDAGEPGLAGWTMYLDINNNATLDAGEPSTVTAADNPNTAVDETGAYEFVLPPNNYTLREVPQAGWTQTSPAALRSTLQFTATSGTTTPAFAHHPNFDHFVSKSGRYEVFTSSIALLPQDTNSFIDVYLIDRDTNRLELISVDTTGVAPAAHSLEPSVSDDGRYVAFRSFATTLTSTTVNASIVNVYVRDRVLQTTQLISNGLSGPANDYSYEPILSGDGRTLMFFSWASNLVAGDNDLLPDLFVKDLVGGQLTRIDAAPAVPTMTIAETWGGDLSVDGRYLTFQAVANGIGQIFWMDRSTNQFRPVSVTPNGVLGNAWSEKRNISADGRYVVFDSSSNNLTSDEGVTDFNVYMKDMLTGEVRLISRNFNGGAANGSRRPDISADGRWVVFESTSQTMFADSANSPSQIVLYDRLTNTLTRLTDLSGTKGNAASVNASISSDGRTIAFQSAASNLSVSNTSTFGPGLFTIERTPDPTATTQAVQVPLEAATTVGGADFGDAQANASISGFAFEDTNRNGVQDGNEAGLANAVVYLDLNDNGVRDVTEPNRVTASDGAYSFTGLTLGSYVVRSEVLSGRVATGPSTSQTKLFGVYSTTTSSLIAELDPQTGATIGVLNPILNASTQIGAAFDGTNVLLLYASAIVRVLSSGATVRMPFSLTATPGLAYHNGLAYFIATVNSWPQLVAFDTSTGQISRMLPITHSLDGYGPATYPIFGGGLGEAPDGNGLIVAAGDVIGNDPRLVRIDVMTGRVTEYATPSNPLTNEFGAAGAGGELFLSASGLIRVMNNQYQLLRDLPTAQTYYALAAGSVLDYAQTVNLAIGQSASAINFGQRTTNSSITGRLWEDRNNNQQADAGEPPMAGVTVYIDTNTNFQFDSGEPSVVTNAQGQYTFSNVPVGDRTVRVVPPASFDVSTPNNRSTRLFTMRVANGAGALLELDPITGAIKNQLSSAVGTSISTSSGLAYDGIDLFFLESNAKILFALNPANGSIRRSLQLTGNGFDGLAVVGNRLYVQNFVNNTILEVDKQLTTILRTLDINQLNPFYFGPTAAIDLNGGLGESADGTRLIVQTNNNSTSILVNPETGIIESQFASVPFMGLAGADGEVFTGVSGSTFVDVYNAQGEMVRRGNSTAPAHVALAAASLNTRGARVRVQRGQDVALDIALRDISRPTAISFTSTSVTENVPVGTAISLLSSTDATPGDTHSYALVPGAGDTDNGLFEIVGNEIRNRQAINFESRPNYSIRVRTTDASGNSFETAQTLTVVNLPEVASIHIGNETAQWSTVDRVIIDFDGPVDIDAGAFLMQKRERDAQGALVLQTVDSTVAVSTLASGSTRVTLTFSGAYVRVALAAPKLSALVDGNYQLTIDSSKVRAAGLATQLDGDRNGTSGGNYVIGTQAADKFFAYYGDIDGDRILGIIDFGQFRNAFGKLKGDPNYNAAFDYDGDEVVGIVDFGQFRSRFGKILNF